MLKRLGENIHQWKPSSKSLSPIDVIRAAWAGIVGVEVAKNSTPTEISGTTLTVLTRSGTWSQQLSFLESRILAEIASLDSATKLTALRFRVGKIMASSQHAYAAPRRIQQALKLHAPLPQATLEEMIARTKARAQERMRARGPRCLTCGLSLEIGNLCAPCSSVARQERVNGIMRLLGEVPWLTDEELRRSLGRIEAADIVTARRMLLTRWKKDLDRLERRKTFSRGEPERATAVAYVLLQTGLTPDRLTRVITKYTLGPRLDALLYGVELPAQ